MAKIYYDLIKLGLRKVENVPLQWRSDVQEMLNA
ncbi:CD1375 family protein [Peribacillus frigoritolerans]|nr:CD1375 family protein [Peribacillus frigoritolerans]MDM5306355.1 CD1375 family protein [Peribacillus frigoritolerans]